MQGTNRAFYVVAGLVVLVLALVRVTAVSRIGRSLLSAVVLISTGLVTAIAGVARTREVLFLAGFSLLMLGVYAAQFRCSTRHW